MLKNPQMEEAAILVAEAIRLEAAMASSYAGPERRTEMMNAERWAGTPIEGADFDASQQQRIANRALWLDDTEHGWNVLDSIARKRFIEQFGP